MQKSEAVSIYYNPILSSISMPLVKVNIPITSHASEITVSPFKTLTSRFTRNLDLMHKLQIFISVAGFLLALLQTLPISTSRFISYSPLFEIQSWRLEQTEQEEKHSKLKEHTLLINLESVAGNKLMYTAYTFFFFFYFSQKNKVNAKFLIKRYQLKFASMNARNLIENLHSDRNLMCISMQKLIIGSGMLCHLATGKCLVNKVQITVYKSGLTSSSDHFCSRNILM